MYHFTFTYTYVKFIVIATDVTLFSHTNDKLTLSYTFTLVVWFRILSNNLVYTLEHFSLRTLNILEKSYM